MDHIDRKILELLQCDSTLTIADIAERIGVSTTPAWKRLKRLEESGIIENRVALVAPDKVGLKLTGFVLIRTSEHTAEWTQSFDAAIAAIPEIIEVHRLAGDIDYLLKIVAPDMEGYDRIYKRLIDRCKLSDVNASFSMEVIKATTALPLDYAG